MKDGTTARVLADYRTAPVSDRMRAMLALLEIFTLDPGAMTPERVGEAIAAGVSREEIRDAFYVAFLFNTYDRLADTLGWELPDEHYYPKAGQRLLKHGYL